MLAQHYHSVVDEAAAKAVLDQVGLAHRMNHRPSQLSGGEQQRVCIARALVNQPPVIFADEPTGNLDETNENLVLNLLTELNRQGRTIVMVTHNPDLGKLTNRIIYLQHGKLLREEKTMNPQRLNKLAKMLGISAVVFFSVSCKEESAQIGQPAPEIAAFDLQGNKASLSDWQGKTVLINFWSETCGACIAELRTLQQWAEKYPNQVQLIAMNIDGEKADTQAIVTKRQLTLPVFKDQMKITAERYQLVGTPTSFVIDPNGKVIYKFEGLISENDLQRLFQPTKS